jgi:hypothetical protein
MPGGSSTLTRKSLQFLVYQNSLWEAGLADPAWSAAAEAAPRRGAGPDEQARTASASETSGVGLQAQRELRKLVGEGRKVGRRMRG